jgi:hypothetical protein
MTLARKTVQRCLEYYLAAFVWAASQEMPPMDRDFSRARFEQGAMARARSVCRTPRSCPSLRAEDRRARRDETICSNDLQPPPTPPHPVASRPTSPHPNSGSPEFGIAKSRNRINPTSARERQKVAHPPIQPPCPCIRRAAGFFGRTCAACSSPMARQRNASAPCEAQS